LPALGKSACGKTVDYGFATEEIESTLQGAHRRLDERIADDEYSTHPVSRIPRYELGKFVTRERLGCVSRGSETRVSTRTRTGKRARTHDGDDETFGDDRPEP
jgi:hypothetical protein